MHDQPGFDRKSPANRGVKPPAVPIRKAVPRPIQIKSAPARQPSPPSAAVTFPPIYNPLRRPSPLQPKTAPLAATAWKPGTGPPVYRPLPHNAHPGALLQRKLTLESKSVAPARGIQPIRLSAPAIGPRPLVSAIQRAAAAANEFKVVKSKGTAKLEKKQHAKASSGPRTLCDAWLATDPASAVQASSGLTLEAWKALSAKAPALADHIGGTREKKETPAIACAEPQALALLLSTFGSNLGKTFTLGNIRISTALDQNTDRTKPPCPNCSTWLEVATGETDAYGDTAYRIRSAFR